MRFTYFLPVWVIVLSILIAVGITVYGYIRIERPIQSLLRYSLIALRFVAIAILLCCLLAPVIIEKKDVTPPTHLSILVDTSRSMQLEDNYLGKSDISRLDQVNRFLFDESSQFIQNLKSKYKVHLYSFDSVLREEIIGLEKLAPAGSLTNISAVIDETVQRWRGQPNAGIILITDGAHNTSTLSVEDIASLKTPIYSIGVGSPQPPRDILIQNVDVLPIAYTGHETVVRINVVQTGYNQESIRVSLREFGSNRLVDASILNFPESDADQSVTLNVQRLMKGTQHLVELKLTPQTEGNFQYKIILPTLDGELTHTNNEKTFSLKVVKAKLNVLYFEGRPRWEYTFLKRTLERDPDIEPTFTILSKKNNPESILKRNDGYFPQDSNTQLSRFPASLDELSKYDVLILGDLTAEHLNSAQQQAIVDFVEQFGKAVIFLPSHNALGVNGFRNTRLAQVLPIQIPSDGCLEQEGEFSVELTQSGMFHPILQLTETIDSNKKMWQNLPSLTRSYRRFQLRAGATTLITKQTGEPVLIFQRVGLGKSLLFAAEGIWNWHFGVNTYKDTTYQSLYPRFWAQTLRWVSQQTDGNHIYLTTASSTYAQGDRVTFNIKAYSLTMQPQQEAEIQLSVTTPSGSTFPLKTHSESADTQSGIVGNFTAQLKVEEIGAYKIQAVGQSGNISLGEDEVEFFVHPQLIELEAPHLNVSLLTELSEKTGGVYVNIEDAHSIVDKISDIKEPVFDDTERDLWAHPFVLITVVGLLGAEWLIRKRNGLI